jgi:triphosphatase
LSPRQNSKELELKLLASPEDLRRLRDSGLVARYAAGPGQEKHLRSVYYDTAEHSLAEQVYSLRVRYDGKTYVQTLKFAPPEEKSFSRHEWETPLHDSKPDLSRLPASAIGPVAARLSAKALVPVFSTLVTRQAIPLSFKGTKLELAFDQGAITAGGCERPLSEIEIELEKGEAARLYELALELLDLAPLRWSTASKFERGNALARGIPPPISKAPSSALAQDTTLDDAIAATLAGCQRHLLANESAAEDGRDPEGVHQMRVALRRMRASSLTIVKRSGSRTSSAPAATGMSLQRKRSPRRRSKRRNVPFCWEPPSRRETKAMRRCARPSPGSDTQGFSSRSGIGSNATAGETGLMGLCTRSLRSRR